MVGLMPRHLRLIDEAVPPPGRLSRLVQAIRSSWSGPYLSNSSELSRLWGAPPVSSGVSVNEATALNYSAVWAAVSLISSQIGALPLPLYKILPNRGGKEPFYSHPLYRLVHDRPNPETSALVFKETLQAHVLLWGNGYAEIVRNGGDQPVALWQLTPDRVTPFRRTPDAPLQYRVANLHGGVEIFEARNILHIPGLGFDGVCGYSIISKARESIGLGLAAERFGGGFFGNGSTFGGVISYPNDPSDLVKENTAKALQARHQGVENAHKFLALWGGAKFERIGIPPNDAQFLESRMFQVDEIARWFNLPPHKLKELQRSTNNNIEHQNLEYYIDCLSPWCVRWQQELCEKLIAKLERNQQTIEFVAQGLLRGDNAGRADFMAKQFNSAAITPNEERELENRNPLPGGDRAFVMSNMLPLDRIDDWLDAEIESKKQPQKDQQIQQQQQTITDQQQQNGRLQEQLDLALRSLHQAEDARDQAVVDITAVRTQLLAEAAAQAATQDATHQAALAEEHAARTHAEELYTLSASELEQCQTERAETETSLTATIVAREATLVERDATIQEQTTRLEVEAARLADVKRAHAELHQSYEDLEHRAYKADELATERGAALIECEATLVEREASLQEQTTRAETAEENHQRELVLRQDTEARELELVAKHKDTLARAVEAEATIAGCNTTITSQAQQLDRLTTDLAVEHDARAIAEEDATTARARAETAEKRADIADATVTELRAQLATLQEDTRSTSGTLADVRDKLARAETALVGNGALKEECTRLSESVRQLTAKRADATAAHRAIYADAMGRMVRREIAKAKAYQATPAKLRTWLENYYDATEAAMFVEAILPSLRLHLAWIGSERDPAECAAALVQRHFAESIEKLSDVITAGPDGFGEVLQRRLHRWEADRAEAFADALVREELA